MVGLIAVAFGGLGLALVAAAGQDRVIVALAPATGRAGDGAAPRRAAGGAGANNVVVRRADVVLWASSLRK